jgi:hypothetical protein
LGPLFVGRQKTESWNALQGATQMKAIDVVSVILVVLGAMNWGFVGLFQFDLVAALLGEATVLSRLVYVVVGVAGLFQAVQWKAIQERWMGHRHPATA